MASLHPYRSPTGDLDRAASLRMSTMVKWPARPAEVPTDAHIWRFDEALFRCSGAGRSVQRHSCADMEANRQRGADVQRWRCCADRALWSWRHLDREDRDRHRRVLEYLLRR